MIRINLLPTRKEQEISEARTQLLAFVAILIAEALLLGLFYLDASSTLSELQAKVKVNQAEVTRAQQEVKDADALKKQAETLSKQLDILKQLEDQRSGPVKVLDELQSILSPPRNEEDRFTQLQKNWNVEWDTRRLWLQSFKESKGVFEMSGGAVNADDVAEFLQRLNTATHFQYIQLDFVKAVDNAQIGGKTTTRLVDWRLAGRLSYSGEKLAPEVEQNAGRGRRR